MFSRVDVVVKLSGLNYYRKDHLGVYCQSKPLDAGGGGTRGEATNCIIKRINILIGKLDVLFLLSNFSTLPPDMFLFSFF